MIEKPRLKNEEVVEFLNSAFGDAHFDLPDSGELFDQGADYTDDGEGDVRLKTTQERHGDQREFVIHALHRALVDRQPNYQYLVALALIEGRWGLSPEYLLEQAAGAGVEKAKLVLDLREKKRKKERADGREPGGALPLSLSDVSGERTQVRAEDLRAVEGSN